MDSKPDMCEPTPADGNTKVIDWVEQQAMDEEHGGSTLSDTNAPSYHPSWKNPRGKHYDILTLLNIRATTDTTNVHLRIHPGALHENIWRCANVMHASRRQMRSRGLSEISQQSIGSNEDDVVLGSRLIQPIRQPYAAPDSLGQRQGFHHRPIRQPNRPPPSLIGARVEGFLSFPQRMPVRRPNSPPGTDLVQQHAGFQRFLKEHASPPHHRVTAGGRIVPANGPPPIFNVNSITGATKSPSRPDALNTNDTTKVDQAMKLQPSASGPLFASAASKHGIVVSGASEQSNIVQNATQPSASTGSKIDQAASLQAQTGAALQHPANTTPIMVLQDGTTFVMQNGLPYRIYSNGLATITEPVPLLFAQQGTAQLLPNSSLLQPSAPQPNYPSMYRNLPETSAVNSNPDMHSHLAHMRPDSSDQNIRQQHETLRNELQSLDKHIALNGKRFGRHDQLAYVALRKQLVQQLDQYRRYLSQNSSSESTGQPFQYTSLGAQPSAGQWVDRINGSNSNAPVVIGQSQSNANVKPSTTVSKTNYGIEALHLPDSKSIGTVPLKTPSIKSNTGAKKVLSPEAPPFVPGSLRAGSARKVESCIPSGDVKSSFLSSRAGSTSTAVAVPTIGLGSRSVSSKENHKMSQPESIRAQTERGHPTGLSHARYGTSGSAMEALIPEVHQQDIAYVDRMALNPIYAPKKYCSTVAEVQEVIRRVREQARLYGCKGGSSKDPEFDAEQDVRWAISDTTPIPLPKKVPDHIAHPRPWYWEDSAFNVYADRSSLRAADIDHQQQVTNNSTVQKPSFELSQAKFTPDEANPERVYHLSQEPPIVGEKKPSAVHRISERGEPTTELPFMSSRQAATLRETRQILGIMPSNNSLLKPGLGKNESQSGIAAPGSRNSHYTEVFASDPFGGTENMRTGDPSNATASPSTKPVVKLPRIRPSGPSGAPEATKSGDGNYAPGEILKDNHLKPALVPSSATNFGTSSFLGTLLKSSFYSSSSSNQHEATSPGNNHSPAYSHGATQMSNKENVRSEVSSNGGGHQPAPRSAGFFHKQGVHQDHGFGKSQSSVAPTTTYAHAQMHLQSGKVGGPFQSLDWEIRHHSPSPARAQSSAASSPFRRQGIPQFDGADERSPRMTKVRPGEPQEVHEHGSPDELDPKTFQTDTNEIPAGHEYAVEKLMKRVKQAEAKDMAQHPPLKGPKKSDMVTEARNFRKSTFTGESLL